MIGILVGIAVFAILLVLVVVFLIRKDSKNSQKVTIVRNEAPKSTLDDLIELASSENTSLQELKKALLIFNDTIEINDDNFKKSMQFLMLVLSHKNRSKELFQIIHKETKTKNKKFKNEIEKVEMQAMS